MARAMTATSPEGRQRLMVIAAVVFAALAAILLFVALESGGEESVTSAGLTREVVVVAQKVDANTKLTADMLEVKSVPTDQVLAGSYASVERAVGLPVRYPLQKGEQVSTSKVGLQAIQDEKDLALVLEPGMRAFSVEATEVTAVGGLLLPGNFVDIIGVRTDVIRILPDGREEERPVAITVLQNIAVLSVAQEAQEPIPVVASESSSDAALAEGVEAAEAGQGLRSQRPEDLERQPGARSVTLAVTPDQAQLLALLQQDSNIDIWLTLRPTDDAAALPLGETTLPAALIPPPEQR